MQGGFGNQGLVCFLEVRAVLPLTPLRGAMMLSKLAGGPMPWRWAPREGDISC